MTEIIFIVEESAEGGFEARALGHSIFTEGETTSELKENIKEAVRCHFEADFPKIIRLHYLKEEIFAAWKKIPRNLSGKDLVKQLKMLGYEQTRQVGSHIRLTTLAEAGQFIYEKDGNQYLTFEISELKEKDKYNRTHTCYVTRIEQETDQQMETQVVSNETQETELPGVQPVAEKKERKARVKKDRVTAWFQRKKTRKRVFLCSEWAGFVDFLGDFCLFAQVNCRQEKPSFSAVSFSGGQKDAAAFDYRGI